MPVDDLNKLKKKLDQTLNSAAESGEELVKKGHELSAAGQSIVDWAGATRDESKKLTDRARIDDLIQTWNRTNETAIYLNVHLAGSLGLVTSTADASNVSSLLNLPPIDLGRGDISFVGTTGRNTGRRILDLALRPEAHRAVDSFSKNWALIGLQSALFRHSINLKLLIKRTE